MTPDDSLLNFVSSVSGDAYVKVEENLGDGFVRLKISEAERRQAKHDIRSFEDVVVEVLRNSRDAHATRIYLATTRDADDRTLTVIDDGVGVPPALHERIFEPRVTSKLETMVTDRWGVHGRGMALFSVRSNVREARVAASDQHKGMALAIVADTTELPERADQSTWPTVEAGEDGRPRVGTGPHNIARRVVEFAVEHPEVAVYLGNPAEIAASLHGHALATPDANRLLFCDDPTLLPVWQRLAAVGGAAELVGTAASIGLPVSERTAHRVMGAEIEPLESVFDIVTGANRPPAEERAPDLYRDRRGLRVASSDMGAFKRALEEAFDTLGERYYVRLRVEPKVTVGRDAITVRFDVEKDD